MVDQALPSIPEYYKRYVNKDVDLDNYPHQPCPFHGETHGKSFSYKDGIWSCFGACHVYAADVIELHRRNYKIKTREEAELSLRKMYNLPLLQIPTFEKKEIVVEPEYVHRMAIYNRALQLATSIDAWLDLDYIVSKVPYDVAELELFCTKYGQSGG